MLKGGFHGILTYNVSFIAHIPSLLLHSILPQSVDTLFNQHLLIFLLNEISWVFKDI